MNDRLKELNYADDDEEEFRSTIRPSSSDKKKKRKGTDDDEDVTNEEAPNEMGKEMGEYYAQVKVIKSDISTIATAIKKLNKEYNNVLSSTSAKEMAKYKSVVNDKVNEISAIIKKCQKSLKEMAVRTKELKDEETKKFGAGGSGAVVRIREQQHVQLSREFMDVMQDYQELQERYKDNYKDRMVRSIKSANSDVTEEEVQQMLQKPNLNPTDVFNADMLTDSQKHTVDALYAEVSETHKDILKLEVSLRELHQLFVDFAALVDAQDEMLDNIEANVMNARAYIDQGIENLKTAKRLEKRSRKCLIM